MPNLACVIPTWRDGALLASAVRSVRPHVDVVICLDGGYLGDVDEDDRWTPTAELLEAREAGAVLYPVIERNASEAAYERARGLPEDYEPLPTPPLDPPLDSLTNYDSKVAALLDLARRHMRHGWALVMHADELLICGDGLRDEVAPFYACASVDVPYYGSEQSVDDFATPWATRLFNLNPSADTSYTPSLMAAPGCPFLRHRAYLRSAVGSQG